MESNASRTITVSSSGQANFRYPTQHNVNQEQMLHSTGLPISSSAPQSGYVGSTGQLQRLPNNEELPNHIRLSQQGNFGPAGIIQPSQLQQLPQVQPWPQTAPSNDLQNQSVMSHGQDLSSDIRAPAAESLMILHNSVQSAPRNAAQSNLHNSSQSARLNSAQSGSSGAPADSSSLQQDTIIPRFDKGPPVTSFEWTRTKKHLIVTWRSPDLSKLGLNKDTLSNLERGIEYNVISKVFRVFGPRKDFHSECSTKQCCYLIPPEDPFTEYEVEVTWRVADESLFNSIETAVSQAQSLFYKVPGKFYVDKFTTIGTSRVYEGFITFEKTKVAVKFLQNVFESERCDKLEKQLRKLKHVNLARYHHITFDPVLSATMLATELCQTLTLESAITENILSPTDCKIATMQIINGMKYLHSRSVFLGNLKPENIFFSLSGRHIKLAYFGIEEVSNQVRAMIFDQMCLCEVCLYIFTGDEFADLLDFSKVYGLIGLANDLRISANPTVQQLPFCLDFLRRLIKLRVKLCDSSSFFDRLLCHPFFWSEKHMQNFVEVIPTFKDLIDKNYDHTFFTEFCNSFIDDWTDSEQFEYYELFCDIHDQLIKKWHEISENCGIESKQIDELYKYMCPAESQCLSGVFTKRPRKRKRDASSCITSSSDESE